VGTFGQTIECFPEVANVAKSMSFVHYQEIIVSIEETIFVFECCGAVFFDRCIAVFATGVIIIFHESLQRITGQVQEKATED
jgi:hypothetical protein